jgi:copper resistance protein C
MKRIPIIIAACLISRAAFPHAFLDRASPAVGSSVASAPANLKLTYTEAVEPAFSTVTVKNASGERVDDGKPAAESGGRVLQVKLKPLQAGTYQVEWHVTSVDTHKTEGHFSFTVKP